MANMKRLGTRLRGLREQAGLTQTQLSKDTQVSQNYISAIERGDVNSPDMEILCLIGGKFGLTPNDIATYAGWWSPREQPAVPAEHELTINRLLKLPRQEREPLLTILRRMVDATYREASSTSSNAHGA